MEVLLFSGFVLSTISLLTLADVIGVDLFISGLKHETFFL